MNKAFSNCSFILSWTYTLSAQLHTWPELITREATIAFAASSKSASSKTIAGAFPPSSSETLVMLSAAAFITSCPAARLPVKLTKPTLGWDANLFPTTDPRPCIIFNTPFGKPTSWQISAKIWALIGVSWLGLRTIVLPVSKAGAAFLAIKKNGKFHGRIPVVTP